MRTHSNRKLMKHIKINENKVDAYVKWHDDDKSFCYMNSNRQPPPPCCGQHER